jgi:hypothetical protein
MSHLVDVIPKAEGETIAPEKTFEDCEPGFNHIAIKLPAADARIRLHAATLFVAIDRARCW